MIIQSDFRPAHFLSNPHIQTILPTLLRGRKKVSYHYQEFELPDGDFIDLAWNRIPVRRHSTPIAIIFHGLEGSIDSPYAKGMVQRLDKLGWYVVVMHFRGCSGRSNHLPRSYHSGDTEDARYLIDCFNLN